MNTRKFPETLYSDINPDDLTTSSCYSAITNLKMPNMKLDSGNAEMVIRSLQRSLADFLDYTGRFYFHDDDEIASLFRYMPDYANPTTENIELLLSCGLPEGYIHYSGRVYRFIDHIVIPHSYQQYWIFMYLNIKNYSLLDVGKFLNRQLLLASDKQQFLSVFKNVIQDNYYGIHGVGVQNHLYEWIDNQRRTLKAQLMALDNRYKVNASYDELILFWGSRFKAGTKDKSPILLPDQVIYFIHANFLCDFPAVERQKFHIKDKHKLDVKRICRAFHDEILDKSSSTDMACLILIENFDIYELDNLTSLKTYFNKYRV